MTQTFYTTCPNCGTCYPVGNWHDCPSHIKLAALSGEPKEKL